MLLRLADFIKNENNCVAALKKLFSEAAKYSNSMVIIESGEYLFDDIEPVKLCSNITVKADGAKFLFPENLGKQTRRIMFEGTDIENLTWQGGHFQGYVYDPENTENLWEPYAYSGCINIVTTEAGKTKNISIKNVTAQNVAGAVVHILGTENCYAENIDVKDCQFLKSGKFMWDYGYLWQRAVFADEYDEKTVENAFKYLPEKHISSALYLKDGKIWADYMPQRLPEERDAITFFGKKLPKGIRKGKQYYVLNKGAENGLLISETECGEPLFIDEMPENTRLFRNMFYIFHDLYAPVGDTAYEKGSVDLTNCKNVNVSNCRISAIGDSMHINKSINVVFANNQILGARMGALYIGFCCDNVTVTGNTVYGTNGSRTMSIECGTKNITITGNTFIGGGRGSWFNQNENIIISDNVFIRNTKKCTSHINVGRICQATGEFESYPELYFTTYGTGYGPVILRGNIIETEKGASAAVAFNPGGKNILMEGNIIRGEVSEIHVASGCEKPLMVNNTGIGVIKDKVFINTANVR